MALTETDILDKKFAGLAVPLSKRKDGAWTSKNTRDLVRSSIYMILTTVRGSRIMNPDFGSPFAEILFEQNDVVLRSEVRNYIFTSLKEWEPRIEVKSVDVSSSGHNFTTVVVYEIISTGEEVQSQIDFARFQPDSVRIR